jgi:hypothetical protein
VVLIFEARYLVLYLCLCEEKYVLATEMAERSICIIYHRVPGIRVLPATDLKHEGAVARTMTSSTDAMLYIETREHRDGWGKATSRHGLSSYR